MPGRRLTIISGLVALLGAVVLLGVGIGAVRIPPLEAIGIILRHLGIDVGSPAPLQDDAILWSIRLPRVLLGVLVGGGLAVVEPRSRDSSAIRSPTRP